MLQSNSLTETPSTQQLQELVDSQPYFSFAPAEDPRAPLIATSLYYRIQVRLSFDQFFGALWRSQLWQPIAL